MSINESTQEPSTMTPEASMFHSLSPADQRRILCDYPRLLAQAAHGYSLGADCETVLRVMLTGAAPMLCVRNGQGDAPIASALIRGQPDRANWLADLAADKNPKALAGRARHRETVLMLSTSSRPAGLLEKLLERDPTELHRPYDIDGRNLLHHCSLEDSTEALETVLRCAARLMRDGKLEAVKVEQAVHMSDRRGDTPMHLMAVRNRPEMLTALLEFAAESRVGVCLDTRRHGGSRWTPLMVAAAADAVETVRLLIDEGADPDEVDAEGRSVAELAGNESKVAVLLASLQRADESTVPSAGSAVNSGLPFFTSVPSAVSAVNSGLPFLTSVPSAGSAVDSGIQSTSLSSCLDSQQF